MEEAEALCDLVESVLDRLESDEPLDQEEVFDLRIAVLQLRKSLLA